jgi:STE24 endopeptidase
MPFLLLLVLAFSCLPVNWPAPPGWITSLGRYVLEWSALGWQFDAGITGALVVVLVGFTSAGLAAWGRSLFVCYRLRQQPSRREVIARKQALFRQYHFLSLLAFQVTCLNFLGWGWAAQGGAEERVAEMNFLPACELLLILPLLASLVISWVCSYGAERALYAGPEAGAAGIYSSRTTYLFFNLRQSMAMVLVPVLLLIGLANLIRLMPQGNAFQESIAAGVSLVAVAVVFTLMPWILRLVLGLRPMPSSETRTRLMAACKRVGFRCSNILIWDTKRGIANAMVAGILPFLRYVVLTDRLLSEMSPDELEAVFGHEVGHVKHRHMWYYLCFLLASFPLLGQIWQLTHLDSLFGLSTRQDLALLPLVPVVGIYIFVVFGFLSRRCERQADIYGCRAVSCGRLDCVGHDNEKAANWGTGGLCRTGIQSFINALEKVAYLNGISRERPGWLQSWQHSTIARRVDFLERVIDDPKMEPRFQRRIQLVKWLLLVGLVSAIVVVGATTGWAGLVGF